MSTKRLSVATLGAVAALVLLPGAALAAAPNPPGDIPDNQAYVAYTSKANGFSIQVPEGWGRKQAGAATTFADKFNVIQVDVAKAAKAPTVASAKTAAVAALRKSVKGFRLVGVSSVRRSAGTAIVISYSSVSAPNAVTGKSISTSAERYEFWHAGRSAILTVIAPAGSDNVDPWKTITNSFRWAA